MSYSAKCLSHSTCSTWVGFLASNPVDRFALWSNNCPLERLAAAENWDPDTHLHSHWGTGRDAGAEVYVRSPVPLGLEFSSQILAQIAKGRDRLGPQDKTRLKNGAGREEEALTRVLRQSEEGWLVLGAFLGDSTSLDPSYGQRTSLCNRPTAYRVLSTLVQLL